jgi:hypothetical protein
MLTDWYGAGHPEGQQPSRRGMGRSMACGPRLHNGPTLGLQRGSANAQIRYQNRTADGVGQVVRAADGWMDCRAVARTGCQVRRSEAALSYRRPISRLAARTVVTSFIRKRARCSRLCSGKERMSLTSDNQGLFHIGQSFLPVEPEQAKGIAQGLLCVHSPASRQSWPRRNVMSGGGGI